ncbi:MAG: alpha/beta fold hydrolase [bacterium]|nr:alpha/beta fold hydrolase [bacterium]
MMKENQSITADPQHAQQFFFSPSSGRPAVLLVHGFTGSPWDLRELGEFLQSNGVGSLGICLPGHGTRDTDLQHRRAEEWLMAVEDGYRRLAGTGSPVMVVGMSLGGILALTAQVQGRIHAKALVTISTPLFFPKEYLHRFIIPWIRWFKGYARKSWIEESDFQFYLQRGKYIRIPLHASHAMYRLSCQARNLVSQVRCPILVIHSSRDQVASPASAKYLYERIGSSEKYLHWLDSPIHNLRLSEKKHSVYSSILQFIKDHE